MRKVFWSTLAPAWLALGVPAHAATLPEAVEQAVRTNPEVLAAGKRLLAADEGVKQAQGAYLPRIDLNTGSGRARLDNADTRALGISDSTVARHQTGLTLSQMLFDGYAARSEVARQRARVEASAHNVAANAEDLALRTVASYLEVLRRQETVAQALDNLDAHQRIHDQIKLLSDSGVGRRADLAQAEGRLALAKANLRQEQSSLRDAEVGYLRLVGAAPRALRIPAAPDSALPSEEQALATALAGHPALKAAQADVALAGALGSGAKAALSPRVDLELAANRGNDIGGGATSDRSITLRLRYNFSNGGADLARINETRYQLEEANDILDRTRLQVQENLALAYNAHATARDRLGALRQYVDASAATRESYARQFSIGQRSLLDLLNAENEYFNARLAYTTGQYAQLAGAFRILAGMGQLLANLRLGFPADLVRAGEAGEFGQKKAR